MADVGFQEYFGARFPREVPEATAHEFRQRHLLNLLKQNPFV